MTAKMIIKSVCFLTCVMLHHYAVAQCRNTESLSGQDILNIIGPQLCENMKSLTISGGTVTDLTPIAHVKTIKELRIGGTSLTTLSSLNAVLTDHEQTSDSHYFSGNDLLTSLVGLKIEGGSIEIRNMASLSSIDFEMSGNIYGEIKITNNDHLQDLNAFADKQYQNFEIVGNDRLEDLSGFSGISIIDPDGNYRSNSLLIKYNNQLKDLTGLQVSTDKMEISNNDRLVDLSGADTSYVRTTLLIQDNKNLASLNGISTFQPKDTYVNITIIRNPGLVSLRGLNGMDHYTRVALRIYENNALTSLRGFENMRIRSVHISNNQMLRSTSGLKNITTFLPFEISRSKIDDFKDLVEVRSRVEIYDNPDITSIKNLGDSEDTIQSTTRVEVYDNDNLELIENLSPKSGISEYFIHDNNALTSISLNHLRTSYKIRENRALTYLKLHAANTLSVQENNLLSTIFLGSAFSLQLKGDAFQELVLNGSMSEIKNPTYDISGEGTLDRLTFQGSLVNLPEVSLARIGQLTIDGLLFLRNPISKVRHLDFRSNDLSVLEVIDFENITINSNSLIDLEGLEDIDANKITISSGTIDNLTGMRNVKTNELIISGNSSMTSMNFGERNITTKKLRIENNRTLETISGLNSLVSGDDEVNFSISENLVLSEIEFGPSDIEVIGQITIRENPDYISCCNIGDWVGDQHFIDKNGGICSISDIFPQQLSDYCDIPVRVYDKRSRKLLNTVLDIDPDKPELIIYEGTEEEIVFEVPKVGEDRVIMQGENGYQFKQEEFSETSTAFEFDRPLFEIEELPDNFKIILSSDKSNRTIKSFDIKPVKRPIIFIDMNEDQGRNFNPLIKRAITKDRVPIGRMERVVFRTEVTNRRKVENRSALINGINEIKRRTLGTERIAVDVVAFGEAGLLARQYLKNVPAADINRFITVNTPHSGSELEDSALLFDNIIIGYRSILGIGKAALGAATVVFTGGVTVPIVILGGISLSVDITTDIIQDQLLKVVDATFTSTSYSYASNSSNVQNINHRFNLIGIPKHSIASIYDYEANDIRSDESVPSRIRFLYKTFDNLFCTDFETAGLADLAGLRNNTYSSVESQFGGLQTKYRSQVNGDYGNLDSDEMRWTIFDLLDNPEMNDRFTTEPYGLREVPESLIAKCESFINYSEIMSFIGRKLGFRDFEKVTSTTEIQIDTLLNDQLRMNYEGDLLSLHVITSDLEFHEADITKGNEISLDVFPNDDSIDPKLYMAFGITPDSSLVEAYYVHVDLEVDLSDYTLQDFEVTGNVGDTLSYQLFARNESGDEVDVTLLVTNDLWPEELINALTPGILIANEAANDTLQFIIAEQEVNIYTDIQGELEYFGLEASDSTLVPENAGLISTVDSVAIITNENIDELTFYVAGDTTIFNATLDEDQFLISVADSLDFETDSVHQFTLVATNNDITDSLTIEISITNVNEAPLVHITDLVSIHENDSNLFVGTVIGTDPEQDSLTYSTSLHEKLSIQNDSLWVISGFDYEADSLVDVDITASDGEFETTTSVILSVTDLNEGPTISIAELLPLNENDSNQYVASISALDPEKDSLSIWLSIPQFELRNDSLWAITAYDHEVDSIIGINLKVSDGVFEDSLATTITIADVNEAPTNVLLDNDSIFVKEMSTAWAGTLSTIDEDQNDAFTYHLEGFTDLFEIRGDSLIVGSETQTELYSLPITTTDQGGLATTVEVILKVEREVILGIPKITFVVYPNPATDLLYIRHAGGLQPEYWIYDLKGSLLLQGKGTQIDVAEITNQLVLLRTCFQGDCHDLKVLLNR